MTVLKSINDKIALIKLFKYLWTPIMVVLPCLRSYMFNNKMRRVTQLNSCDDSMLNIRSISFLLYLIVDHIILYLFFLPILKGTCTIFFSNYDIYLLYKAEVPVFARCSDLEAKHSQRTGSVFAISGFFPKHLASQ